MSGQDSILLTSVDLEALATVYQPQELHDAALIRQLLALQAKHPELLVCRHGPDADLCANAEAGLSQLGRSLVNAFMSGQINALRQVREFSEGRLVVCGCLADAPGLRKGAVG